MRGEATRVMREILFNEATASDIPRRLRRRCKCLDSKHAIAGAAWLAADARSLYVKLAEHRRSQVIKIRSVRLSREYHAAEAI